MGLFLLYKYFCLKSFQLTGACQLLQLKTIERELCKERDYH